MARQRQPLNSKTLNWKLLPICVGALWVLSSAAYGLTITNHDEVSLSFDVENGTAEGQVDTYELHSGRTMIVPCLDGCSIRLENGEKQELNGNETIEIRNRVFVIEM